MRTQIERMKSRELLQEEAYEGRLHDLFQRQAQLETRASLVANLAQRASIGADVTGGIARGNPKAESVPKPASHESPSNPLLSPRFSDVPSGLPQAATGEALGVR